MTMGLFGAFIILLFKLYDPVRKFAYFYNSFQQAMGASASIFSFFDTEDDVKERPHAATLKGFSQSIRFENVGFSYSTEEGEHQILHNVDLDVHAGEVARARTCRSQRRGQVHTRQSHPALLRRVFGPHPHRRQRCARPHTRSLRRQIAQVTQETILFNDNRAPQHRLRPAGHEARARRRGCAQPPLPTTLSCACRRATTR